MPPFSPTPSPFDAAGAGAFSSPYENGEELPLLDNWGTRAALLCTIILFCTAGVVVQQRRQAARDTASEANHSLAVAHRIRAVPSVPYGETSHCARAAAERQRQRRQRKQRRRNTDLAFGCGVVGGGGGGSRAACTAVADASDASEGVAAAAAWAATTTKETSRRAEAGVAVEWGEEQEEAGDDEEEEAGDDDEEEKEGGEATGEACAICLAGLAAADAAKELKCGHCYHATCLDAWLEVSADCPLCKRAAQASPSPMLPMLPMPPPPPPRRTAHQPFSSIMTVPSAAAVSSESSVSSVALEIAVPPPPPPPPPPPFAAAAAATPGPVFVRERAVGAEAGVRDALGLECGNSRALVSRQWSSKSATALSVEFGGVCGKAEADKAVAQATKRYVFEVDRCVQEGKTYVFEVDRSASEVLFLPPPASLPLVDTVSATTVSLGAAAGANTARGRHHSGEGVGTETGGGKAGGGGAGGGEAGGEGACGGALSRGKRSAQAPWSWRCWLEAAEARALAAEATSIEKELEGNS